MMWRLFQVKSVSLSIEWLLVDLLYPWSHRIKKIVKFVPKPRVWKLKYEETSRLFTHEMAARNDEISKADDIQKRWLLMKTWLKASK